MTSSASGDESSRMIDLATAQNVLKQGAIEEQGVIPWSSNYALLVNVSWGEIELMGIYKPRWGERPLWDFPPGSLYIREVAAYLLSEGLGWGLVPPTLLREGPYGLGSLQVYIDSDPEEHYFNLYPHYADEYRRIALFDVIANNADRKGGHCLLDDNKRMWSIDHGICFHRDYKLRTVIWEFAGEPISTEDRKGLIALKDQLAAGTALYDEFSSLLNSHEVDSMCRRLDILLTGGRFPYPDPERRNHPWPPI